MSTAKHDTLDKLIINHRDDILAIAARYGAVNVRVFGSVARGEAGPDSDVDILVDLTRKWSLFDRIGLKQDLEDLLECDVDIAIADSLYPRMRDQILAEAIPL